MSHARLVLEHESVVRTLALTDLAWLADVSPELLHYRVIYEVRTLVRDARGLVREAELEVAAAFHLHPEHPRIAPLVVLGRNDLHHPNIHDPARGEPPFAAACLGDFNAERRCGEWMMALWEVLAWQRVGLAHGLNPEAAAFALTRGPAPVDPRSFLRARRTRGAGTPAPGSDPERPEGVRFLSEWRP
jgi:hypothetical protein